MGAACGMILEGIPGSGKTSTIRQLQKLPAFLQRTATSFLLIGEEMTQRTLELRTAQGTLGVDDHVQLLDEIILPLEWQQKRFADRGWNGEQKNFQFLYLLERFHLTHTTYYPYLRDWDYQSIEQRLGNLSAKGCLFTIDPSVMQERIINSRPFPAWRKYLSRYGENDQAIIQHYIQQQEELLAHVKRSRLDWLVIDTSEANWSLVAPQVWKHWSS